MKILIDADASPVTKIATQIAEKVGIPLVLVCDTSHILYSDYGEVIVVSKGMDAADFALINRVDQGDIIITGDYGVAAMSLAKKAFPISHNGKWYTNDNMNQLLLERHISKKSRRSDKKFHSRGPKKRTKEDDIKFRESLLKLIAYLNE